MTNDPQKPAEPMHPLAVAAERITQRARELGFKVIERTPETSSPQLTATFIPRRTPTIPASEKE